MNPDQAAGPLPGRPGPMSPRPQRRRRKLIAPGLQLRMVGAFLAMSALSLLLQFMLFARNLSATAASLPNDGAVLMGEMNRLLAETLLLSFAIGLPVTALVGVLQTFKVAGPIHRFREFLGDVARGEQPEDCRIRRGDELHEFCRILNEATAPLRTREGDELTVVTDVDESPGVSGSPTAERTAA